MPAGEAQRVGTGVRGRPKRTRRFYSDEFKLEAMRTLARKGATVPLVSKELRIPPGLLYYWARHVPAPKKLGRPPGSTGSGFGLRKVKSPSLQQLDRGSRTLRRYAADLMGAGAAQNDRRRALLEVMTAIENLGPEDTLWVLKLAAGVAQMGVISNGHRQEHENSARG